MEFSREFFYDEVRDGFYVPGMMKRSWASSLTILEEIDRICEKYGIPYFGDFGTLIGAVREGGFIPWDDDIDITMLRDDFDRFIRVLDEELPEELKFSTLENNRDSCNFVCALGTTEVVFRPYMLRKYHEFPYFSAVDIFVLDDLSDDPEEEEYRQKVLDMFAVMIRNVQKGKEKTKAFQRELREIEKLLKIQFDRNEPLEGQFYQLMDRVFREFNGEGGKNVACIPLSFGTMPKTTYPKSIFYKIKRVPFVNTTMPIPEDYDTVLKAKYGDYRKKVKAGGGHNYPFYKKHEDNLRKAFQDKWFFHYQFDEEDMQRPKVENLRDFALQTVDYFEDSQKKLFAALRKGDFDTYLQGLSALQNEAINFGNTIERIKGEGTESVSVLEQLCEALYHAYNAVEGMIQTVELEKDSGDKSKKQSKERKEMEDFVPNFPTAIWMDAQKICKKPLYYLKKLRNALEKDFKRQVVFLPHTVRHFESLRPLIDALRQTDDFECKIIPIPYYDKYGDGGIKEMHYEGEDFPKEYQIIDYRSYDFSKELPDCIVINSPYDNYNPVWTVDPFFYSKEMKKFTKKLVYIPWFVTDEIDPKDKENGKALINMENYVYVPGIFNADLSIVQSELMKKAYLSKISAFAGTSVRKRMSKKISGAGSCLLGEKEGQGTKALVAQFRRFLLRKNQGSEGK